MKRVLMYRSVLIVIHKRDRMAQRADKWWKSIWHKQMCMQDTRDQPSLKRKEHATKQGRTYSYHRAT